MLMILCENSKKLENKFSLLYFILYYIYFFIILDLQKRLFFNDFSIIIIIQIDLFLISQFDPLIFFYSLNKFYP